MAFRAVLCSLHFAWQMRADKYLACRLYRRKNNGMPYPPSNQIWHEGASDGIRETSFLVTYVTSPLNLTS